MCQVFSDVTRITDLRISTLTLKIEVLEVSMPRLMFSLSELHCIFFFNLFR